MERPIRDQSMSLINHAQSVVNQTQSAKPLRSSLERPRSETSYALQQQQQKQQQKINGSDACWPEDFYRDFDELYKSMCLNEPEDDMMKKDIAHEHKRESRASNRGYSNQEAGPSMLHQHIQPDYQNHSTLFPNLCSTPLMPRSPSDFGLLQSSHINSAAGLMTQQLLQTPICSYGNSMHEGTISPSGRADSRDTYQSWRDPGPALVEEMTLTDLEDEISFSLMASREMQKTYTHKKKRNSSSLKCTTAGSTHQNRYSTLDSGQHHYQSDIECPKTILNSRLPTTTDFNLHRQPQRRSEYFPSTLDQSTNCSNSPSTRNQPIRDHRPFNS